MARLTRMAAASAVLMAVPTSEVEFNCPWCNTRLALPRSDFQSERAVLCPRCNNPIDLDIQRRLARTPATASTRQTPALQRQSAPPPPAQAPPRRQVTVTKSAPPPPLHKSEPIPKRTTAAPPLRQAPQAGPKAPAPGASSTESLDWSKPLDIDSSFSRLTAPAKSQLTSAAPSGASPFGSKLRCLACGFENAKVPPEFSFGSSQKCAWCGKPLPES